MIIKTAKFICSSPSYETLPTQSMPEFAFVGRSNVGKSSLINYICNNSNLAKVSKVPGKTRLFNHFLVNDLWLLVDMPGYGFAKTDKKTRLVWGDVIEKYILHRSTMRSLFVLVDGSIPPQKIDLDFIAWLSKKNIPTAVIVTKIDKSNQKEVNSFLRTFEKEIDPSFPIFTVSSIKKTKIDEILEYIDNCIQ
ncbi:MAG: ribosome biogenesis GTP-binding protein YihA/YsxC [Patescibacteria group bacterium]